MTEAGVSINQGLLSQSLRVCLGKTQFTDVSAAVFSRNLFFFSGGLVFIYFLKGGKECRKGGVVSERMIDLILSLFCTCKDKQYHCEI